MAVTHLSEEMVYRANIKELPEVDLRHLNGDIKRVYVALATKWLSYTKHLKANYPFLFSLAIRTNRLTETPRRWCGSEGQELTADFWPRW